MNRSHVLDGIRGYSALSVLIFHAVSIFDFALGDHIFYTPIQDLSNSRDLFLKIFLTISNGQAAVTYFFILSGVVLFQSLNKKHQQNFLVTALEFVIKRILRIYPALICCLLVFLGLTRLLHVLLPTTFIKFPYQYVLPNILLYKITVNPPTWTLHAEILVIPFILFAFYFFKKIGFVALFIFLGYAILSYENIWLAFGLFYYPVLICFALGFLIPTELGKQIFSFFKSTHCFFFLILSLVVRQVLPFSSVTGFISQALFTALLVGILFYHPSGRIYNFFTHKISLYLGKISYSFYLINPLALFFFHKMMLLVLGKPLISAHVVTFGLLNGLLTLIVSIPLAHVSYKYIEEPFSNIKFSFTQAIFTKRNITSPSLLLGKE